MNQKENVFSTNLSPNIDSNYFDLSHDVKMGIEMGNLTPSCLLEVVPGDNFKIQVETMIRFMPLVSPVMHKIKATTHYYFVPNRLLWKNWEKFITGQKIHDQDIIPPIIDWKGASTQIGNTIVSGTIGNYMGLPLDISPNDLEDLQIQALPFAAYLKVYYDWYMDENIQNNFDSLTPEDIYFITDDGPLIGGAYPPAHPINLIPFMKPLKRAWMHDYFTSCLPWAQRGEAVTLPLFNGNVPDLKIERSSNGFGMWKQAYATNPVVGDVISLAQGITGNNPAGAAGIDQTLISYDPNGTLFAPMDDMNQYANDVNSLRRAFALQSWLEKNARGGVRYIEHILNHFGVQSSDGRMDRAEYIGGKVQDVIISEVLQTVDNSRDDSALGKMGGHAISIDNSEEWTFTAEEHGFIIGILNVQPITGYHQGIHRMFKRATPLDYYWPSFANIGEQEVYNWEIKADHSNPNGTFGYLPRYSEYKYMNSRSAASMADNLRFWAMDRHFNGDVNLNIDFIRCNPSTDIFAVNSDLPRAQPLICHVFNNIGAIRKMPKFSVPAIL